MKHVANIAIVAATLLAFSSAAFADPNEGTDPFGTEKIVVPGTDSGTPDFDRAYFSESREGLGGERLYEALLRPDLVERFQSRRRARRALLGTGIGLLSAGVLIALPVTAVGGLETKYDDRRDLLIGGAVTLGIAIGVGTPLTVIGALFRSRPISARATRRLIDRFNRSRDPEPVVSGSL